MHSCGHIATLRGMGTTCVQQKAHCSAWVVADEQLPFACPVMYCMAICGWPFSAALTALHMVLARSTTNNDAGNQAQSNNIQNPLKDK